MMKIVFIFSLFLFFSCSKKPENATPKYTPEEFMALAHQASLASAKGEDAIKFSDYSPGVNKIDSVVLKFQRLVFFAVAFETQEEARSEALRLNQYYARNWLFDRVEGEPLLEDYVITTFKAQNPKRKIQRKPKNPPAVHGEAHGEGHSGAGAHGQAHH